MEEEFKGSDFLNENVVRKYEVIPIQMQHPFFKQDNKTIMCLFEGETVNGQADGFGMLSFTNNKNDKDLYSF